MKHTFSRLRILATGRAVWVEVATGKETVEHMPWGLRWSLFGVHDRNWWWVNRWGKRACGCTFNPVTRRRVWISGDCREHFGLPRSERRRARDGEDDAPESQEGCQ